MPLREAHTPLWTRTLPWSAWLRAAELSRGGRDRLLLMQASEVPIPSTSNAKCQRKRIPSLMCCDWQGGDLPSTQHACISPTATRVPCRLFVRARHSPQYL